MKIQMKICRTYETVIETKMDTTKQSTSFWAVSNKNRIDRIGISEELCFVNSVLTGGNSFIINIF